MPVPDHLKMATVNVPSSRANIRIEIKNDFTEEMEVENPQENADIEDGEISESKSNEDLRDSQTKKLLTSKNKALNRIENQWQNPDGDMIVGEDIFSNDEEEKIVDEELHELYASLGICETDSEDIRYDAIHMYGTKELNNQDIFEYFGKYNPASIEWINDQRCNVVWLSKITTAKALLGLSRKIEGMPVSGDGKKSDSEIGKSILLKDREVLLSDNGKIQEKIHVNEIDISIPPGFWRLGESHHKAKYILLRYATRSDTKPLKTENFSEFHRKYGILNCGGIKGLISESKRKKMKGLISEEKVPSGNPWGSLARNWNSDVHEVAPESEVPFVPKNISKAILNRLGGNKRQKSPEKSPEPETKKSKIPRMKMYADEEEARLEKIKQLKKIHELEKIEQSMAQTPDLRNRIGRHGLPSRNKIQIPEIAQIQPIRVEVRRNSEYRVSSDEDQVPIQQRSKVQVIVKKSPAKSSSKPTVASTIWSRLDLEKREKPDATPSDSESSSDSSESSESEEEYNSATKQKFSKAVNSRPGFNRDLKSRLGLTTDHKSPLRIEINNDHYKKS